MITTKSQVHYSNLPQISFHDKVWNRAEDLLTTKSIILRTVVASQLAAFSISYSLFSIGQISFIPVKILVRRLPLGVGKRIANLSTDQNANVGKHFYKSAVCAASVFIIIAAIPFPKWAIKTHHFFDPVEKPKPIPPLSKCQMIAKFCADIIIFSNENPYVAAGVITVTALPILSLYSNVYSYVSAAASYFNFANLLTNSKASIDESSLIPPQIGFFCIENDHLCDDSLKPEIITETFSNGLFPYIDNLPLFYRVLPAISVIALTGLGFWLAAECVKRILPDENDDIPKEIVNKDIVARQNAKDKVKKEIQTRRKIVEEFSNILLGNSRLYKMGFNDLEALNGQIKTQREKIDSLLSESSLPGPKDGDTAMQQFQDMEINLQRVAENYGFDEQWGNILNKIKCGEEIASTPLIIASPASKNQFVFPAIVDDEKHVKRKLNFEADVEVAPSPSQKQNLNTEKIQELLLKLEELVAVNCCTAEEAKPHIEKLQYSKTYPKKHKTQTSLEEAKTFINKKYQEYLRKNS